MALIDAIMGLVGIIQKYIGKKEIGFVEWVRLGVNRRRERHIKIKSHQSNKFRNVLLVLFMFFLTGVKAMEISNIVADEKMAAGLAEVYIANIYGEQAAERQKPYAVIDAGIYWHVQGFMPKRRLGGTFEIHIAKDNGKILLLTHGR